MRINKFISLCGIASRRAADALIEEGRVQVNGDVIKDLGHQIDENADQVLVDGKPARLPRKTTTIMFHNQVTLKNRNHPCHSRNPIR